MKKTITLFLFAVICIVGTSNAQRAQSTPIDELLNRLEQIGDSYASISDYFTQEEQLQLRSHFSKKGVTTITQTSRGLDPNASFIRAASTGNNVYNAPAGTATRIKYGDNDQTRMPVVITHSNTQTIEAGAEIACASSSGTSFRDNSVFRDFDLATDFGIAGDFEVTNAEIAIGAGVSTPAGFPMTVNIWSSTGAAFPNGTLTLLASEEVTITAADSETLISVPIAATVPAGEVMVLEAKLVDDLTDTNFMRFGANLAGQTGVSWILADACGATVISDMAVAFGLDNSFVMNVVGDEATSGGGVAYCAMNSTNEFGTFDLTDGTVVTALGISPAAGFENAGSIDPNDTATAYVLDNAGGAYTVDVATGVYTALGNIAGDWLGAEFDPTTGIYYAIAADFNLYSVDFGGLAATLVGATGFSGFPVGLAIDGNGDAYAYDIGDDNLYSVDLGSGASTIIGSIGFDANFGQGMAWDADSDTVYMTAFNAAPAIFDAELRTVDLATGATTLINQMDNAALTQYGWVAMQNEIILPTGPVNDLCVNAIDVNCGDAITGDSTDATNIDNPGTCDTDLSTAPGLWYALTIPADGDYDVTVDTFGSAYDTKLGVFSGDCAALVCVAGNDDDGGLQSLVNFNGASGETYYFYVTGYSTNAGIFNLNVVCTILVGYDDNAIAGFNYYPNPATNAIKHKVT